MNGDANAETLADGAVSWDTNAPADGAVSWDTTGPADGEVSWATGTTETDNDVSLGTNGDTNGYSNDYTNGDTNGDTNGTNSTSSLLMDLEPGDQDAPNNEQFIRFVLLTHMLKNAGMCTPDIKVCLSRYVNTLSQKQSDELTSVLPRATAIADADDFQPSVTGIMALSDNTIPDVHVYLAVTKGQSFVVNGPDRFMGPNGWFLWMAIKLTPGRQFWTEELELTLWVATMARLHLMDKSPRWTTGHMRRLYREGWWTIFGLVHDTRHFDQVCECDDVSWVYEEEMYTTDLIMFEDEAERQEKMATGEIALDFDIDEDAELTGSELIEHEVGMVLQAYQLIEEPINPQALYAKKLEHPFPVPRGLYEARWKNPEFRKLLRKTPALEDKFRREAGRLRQQENDVKQALGH